MLFTRVGNWRRDARRLRVSFALSLSLLFSLSLSQSRLSLPPFFSFLLSISLTRHPTLSYHPSLSLSLFYPRVSTPSAFLQPRKAHCSTKRAHRLSNPFCACVVPRSSLSLSPFLRPKCLPATSTQTPAAECSFPFRHCVGRLCEREEEGGPRG